MMFMILALLKQRSDPATLFIACAFGFVFGIMVFIRGFRLLQRRRLIPDTPSSKIRSASMGLVEINGLAVGPHTMIAPLTARPCYYYRTLVWEYKQKGKNKQWVKIAGECMHVPFYVDDNTGRMLVDPRGADLELHRDFEQEFNGSFFSGRDDAPANVIQFMARHGVATRNKIKVAEFCIKPKNSLFVLGTLAENPGVEVTPRPVQDQEVLSKTTTLSSGSFALSFNFGGGSSGEEAFARQFAPAPTTPRPQVIQLSQGSGPSQATDMTQQQKVAAALVKAGISNPAAWSAAGVTSSDISTPGVQVVEDASSRRSSAQSDVASTESAAATNSFDPRPPVVLMKGANNKAFLISWRSQREVAETLEWQCTLMIWGGPLLAMMCLYLFLNAVHLV